MTTREELFAILVKKTKEAGHQISFSEFKNDLSTPHPNEYACHFGSFELAAEQAYRKVTSNAPAKKITLKKPIKPIKKPYQKIDHTKHFGRPHN